LNISQIIASQRPVVECFKHFQISFVPGIIPLINLLDKQSLLLPGHAER